MLFVYSIGHLTQRRLISEGYGGSLTQLAMKELHSNLDVILLQEGEEEPIWAFNCILRIVQSEKERLEASYILKPVKIY
jgi:hypothetical protein